MFTPSRSRMLHLYFKYTATVLIFFITVWVSGLTSILRVEAAQITQFSDTLSTSAPGVAANHTIKFTTASLVEADGSTITITFPSGFNMSFIGEDDVDIADDGVDLTTGASCGAVDVAVSTSSQTISFEMCGGGTPIATSSVVTIEVGNNATSSGTGVNRISNHSNAGSYEVMIGGTMADSGSTRIVVVEQVKVTGTVNTFLVFNIAGVDAGQSVNNDPTSTFSTTTATSVSFGTILPGTEYVLAQDIFVTTNAQGGFTVTVSAGGNLESSPGVDINSFTDGAGSSPPVVWAPPSGTPGSPDTYGHWGLTTEDITLSDGNSFGNALYAGNFINNPREIMYSTSSSDGTTPHIGTTRVGYKVEITTMQEAASDYTTSLTYIVTPTF